MIYHVVLPSEGSGFPSQYCVFIMICFLNVSNSAFPLVSFPANAAFPYFKICKSCFIFLPYWLKSLYSSCPKILPFLVFWLRKAWSLYCYDQKFYKFKAWDNGEIYSDISLVFVLSCRDNPESDYPCLALVVLFISNCFFPLKR